MWWIVAAALVAPLQQRSADVPTARSAPTALSTVEKESVEGIVRDEMRRRHIPGMQVAIVRRGAVVFSRGYGIADLETGAPVTPSTRFTLNSATKAFTGVAIMQLVEGGRLSLDDPVGRHVPDLPPAWRGVTLRQLLTHVSGLPDVLVQAKGQGTGSLVGDGGEAAAWDAVKAIPVEAPPGTRFRYNQTNYILLGKVIDRVSGMPFTRFMTERQFAPVGAGGMAFGDGRDVMPGRTRTYRYGGGDLGITARTAPLTHAFDEFSPFMRTAGGLNGSAGDVAAWVVGLRDGRLLGAGARATLWSPGRYADGRPTQWGMGWPLRPRERHGAATAIGGRRSAVFVYPADDLAVVVLTNLAGANPEEFVEEIAGVFHPALRLVNGGGLLPATDRLRRALVADGFADAATTYARLQRADRSFAVPEEELNDWGGRLLQADRTDQAVAIFALAAHLHPSSANAHDSLAEGYEMAGRSDLAIAAYRRSLTLDPANDHATARLATLGVTN